MIKNIGYTTEIEERFNGEFENGTPARVVDEGRGIYKVISNTGKITAKLSGKFGYETENKEDFPAVGDWVNIEELDGLAVIHGVMERKSCVMRKAAGNRFDKQIIASNIDILFICTSMNEDFNLRRIERYVSMGYESGATPIIVVTKADLCEDKESYIEDLNICAPGTEVAFVSSVKEDGIEEIKKYLKTGTTIALTGSSGVGKSTLINRILNKELQDTGDIREDGKGRHTTTSRNVIVSEDGVILIDTPGMRELCILDYSDGISESFEEIEEYAKECRFSNCEHKNEPGCAVRKAIETGEIDEDRLTSYNSLKREAKFLEKKLKVKERMAKNKGNKKKRTPRKKVRY